MAMKRRRWNPRTGKSSGVTLIVSQFLGASEAAYCIRSVLFFFLIFLATDYHCFFPTFSPGLNVEVSSEEPLSLQDVLKERRVVDLGYVLTQIECIARHPMRCTSGRMRVISEFRQDLHSAIRFRCNVCGTTEVLRTERPPNGLQEVNRAFVWGAISVGIGYSQAEEFFSILDVPVLSAPAFREHEKAVGEVSWYFFLPR